ncbi:MAG: hypothetical protein Q4G58_06570 [bacterium]|nr:hypothetical protein [bacterium]
MSSLHKNGEYRESNTRLERLTLIEHWKNPVFSLMRDNSPIIDGVFEIFLTTNSINERVKKLKNKEKYSYCQVPVIQVIDAIFHQTCRGLAIHGLAPEELYITKTDLRPIEEQADTIVTFMAVAAERLTKADALSRLLEKEFYMLGHIPREFNPEEDLFTFDTIEMEEQQYVKLFITRDHARENNNRNFEICMYTLGELVEGFKGRYGLAFEPKEDYTVSYGAEDL